MSKQRNNEWSSPGHDVRYARYNYAWGTANKLQANGWGCVMDDEENLVFRTTKGSGIDGQEYHWRLLEDEDWGNFRAFVKQQLNYSHMEI